MHKIKRIGLVLLALFFVVSGIARPLSGAAYSSEPNQLYDHAWQLIKNTYYDPTYAGQDWDHWRHHFDGKLANVDQARDAIKEMLGSLKDPYTRLLEPTAFKEENDAINSVVCGICISLRPYNESKLLVINEVISEGPAQQAGLRHGDIIAAIDGKTTSNIDNQGAGNLIRGQAGSSVVLDIKRGETVIKFKLVRARVQVPSVTAKVLNNDIGYIKLATFMADDASAEFRWALSQLADKRGIIIDLRGNPGGLLANAIDIANMLMDSGKIVTTSSRKGSKTDSCCGLQLTRQPLVLLVDGDSASASEILAAALKDNRRAVVVGTKTFGKGLVQEINHLPDGSGLHVTVAKYFTPAGTDINKKGIAPDVEAKDEDNQLNVAMGVMNRMKEVANNSSVTWQRQPALAGSRAN